MSETPFRVECVDHDWWLVVAPNGKSIDRRETRMSAIARASDLNAAWTAANGPELTRQRDEAVELLTKYEWSGPVIRGGQAVGQRTCIECGNRKKQGHTPDCRLAAALNGGA